VVERNAQPAWLRLAGLGFELAASIAGGALLGWWLDRRLGTEPKLLIVLAAVGIVGGLYNVIRLALSASRDAERAAQARPAEGPVAPPHRHG
jgi:F0F1-type ATP synthase assembly protein I